MEVLDNYHAIWLFERSFASEKGTGRYSPGFFLGKMEENGLRNKNRCKCPTSVEMIKTNSGKESETKD